MKFRDSGSGSATEHALADSNLRFDEQRAIADRASSQDLMSQHRQQQEQRQDEYSQAAYRQDEYRHDEYGHEYYGPEYRPDYPQGGQFGSTWGQDAQPYDFQRQRYESHDSPYAQPATYTQQAPDAPPVPSYQNSAPPNWFHDGAQQAQSGFTQAQADASQFWDRNGISVVMIGLSVASYGTKSLESTDDMHTSFNSGTDLVGQTGTRQLMREGMRAGQEQSTLAGLRPESVLERTPQANLELAAPAGTEQPAGGLIAGRAQESSMFAAPQEQLEGVRTTVEGATKHARMSVGAVREAISGAASQVSAALAQIGSAITATLSSSAAAIAAPAAAGAALAGVLVLVVVMALGGIMSPGSGGTSSWRVSTAGEIGDDYPYPDRYGASEYSPLGYAYGNCTDFVAYRINRDAGTTAEPWTYVWGDLTPEGGDGKDWGLPGNLPGWSITENPVPGDIFSVPAGFVGAGSNGGPYGHVGYVAQVNSDGSILTENYGNNQYFQLTFTRAEIDSYIASGVVFKHNPANTESVSGGEQLDPNAALLTPADAQEYAASQLANYGWDDSEMSALIELWNGESGWQWNAENASSGAYGIPQSLPADKMATAGADWRTNPRTQIDWGLEYIKDRYGSPSAAYAFWLEQDPHWY